MKYLTLTNECSQFNLEMNWRDVTVDLLWRAEGGYFEENSLVGLQSIIIYPINYEHKHTSDGKIHSVKNLPRECILIKSNLIRSGIFNPEKVISTFPIEKHTSYIHAYFPNPGNDSYKSL